MPAAQQAHLRCGSGTNLVHFRSQRACLLSERIWLFTLEVSAARSGCVSLALGMGMPMTCVGATAGGITMPCGTHAVGG